MCKENKLGGSQSCFQQKGDREFAASHQLCCPLWRCWSLHFTGSQQSLDPQNEPNHDQKERPMSIVWPTLSHNLEHKNTDYQQAHTHTPTEHSLEPTLRFPCINSALTSGVLLTVPHKLRTHQSWFPLLMVFLLWLNGSFVFPPAINHAIRIANGTVIPCDIWVWFYESKDTFFCHQRLRERLGNAHVPKDEACIWLNYDAS